MGLHAVVSAVVTVAALVMSAPASAQGDATRRDETLTVRDFVFHDGAKLPELTLAWTTVGTPHRNARGEIDNAVMALHGTGGNGASFLGEPLGTALFGSGAPFDKSRYYVILPDAIGHGGSSKPSDGLRMAFPAYDYADMVEGEKAMLAKLGVRKLKAIIGMSMGGMMTFQWATTYPEFAEKFIPIGAYPVEVAGQNRMQRKLTIDAIKADPLWKGGNYTTPPLAGLRTATSIQMLMSGSALNLQTGYPTRAAADAFVEQGMAASLASGRDANDMIYQTDASRTYNPWDKLGRISAPLLWINFADDLVNPVSLGIADKAVARMPHARFVLVSASDKTRGHGTLFRPEYWIADVAQFMAE
ncbi:alpha/beta fold hydrolase [Sphingobium nicotianae]|uniref:Alpha/beta fold hydrolase n=1 Tax=Sphingobium nicotianae TaxID=2782607 RepID=A0A9X1DCZ0_9SPHN|nr:alpha/beta fold hydrolase [Sphingobium nicotianae]MBT2187624.1 alpha/beta fold hydrolase [Sphingobium nicotianae]